jgi:predicted permease
MAWLGEQWRRLSLLLKREQLDRELREEIALHRELRAEKLQEQGLSMDEAAAQAQRRMGNVLLLREQTRDAGGWPWLEALGQGLLDLRYGLRACGKNPGFTFVIVISLAVGIGANTVVFSILDALLLKPLPYPQAERLVNVWVRSGPDGAEAGLSLRHYFDIRQRTEVFQETGVALNGTSTLTGAGQPEMIEGLSVSSGFLRLLGAKPLFGRLILPEDDGPGKPTVAVLTYGLCNRLFGGSSNVVGKSIILNGVQHTVIGVLLPDIPINQEIIPQSGIANVEILLSLPLPADAAQNTRYGYYSNFHVMVRLKRDVSLRQAQAAADTLSGRMRQAERLGDAFRLALVPLLEQVVAGNIRSTMLALIISVSLVLLIACVNVASLLLFRAAGRRKEIAIRTALGARGARLVRQLLTESTLLGVLGGAAGLALAAFGLYVMRAINPGNIPRLDAITVDNRVLAFTFGISILTGLLFGLAPALRASDIDLSLTLKAGEWTARRSGLRPSRRGLRGLLVICELAFSLMLLTSAGLLIRSFVRLQEVSPGFNADHVVSLRLRLSGPKYYNIGTAPATYNRMLSGIETLPGVKARGAVSVLPFAPEQSIGSLEVEGYPR